MIITVFFFFKQKTAYEMRISDWSSDVCSSDLCAVAQPPLVVQRRDDAVMDIGGRALVHHLGLHLRVEILGDHAGDAQHLALPGVEARRGLFKEIEDILLRQMEQRLPFRRRGRADRKSTRLNSSH